MSLDIDESIIKIYVCFFSHRFLYMSLPSFRNSVLFKICWYM